jgi:hypothetical protein
MSNEIDALLQETRGSPPGDAFRKNANVNDPAIILPSGRPSALPSMDSSERG